MSRTYRRRSIKVKDISEFGYLYGPDEVWSMWKGGLELKWKAPYTSRKTFDNYEEYKSDAISRFYRDCGYDVVLKYNTAPWSYRNNRNRSLRRRHKSQIHHSLMLNETDIVIDEFSRTAGWDFW